MGEGGVYGRGGAGRRRCGGTGAIQQSWTIDRRRIDRRQAEDRPLEVLVKILVAIPLERSDLSGGSLRNQGFRDPVTWP